MSRPRIKWMCADREWVDRDVCAFGGPGCRVRPESGHLFCPDHTEMFSRVRADLDRERRRGHHSDADWEQLAA